MTPWSRPTVGMMRAEDYGGHRCRSSRSIYWDWTLRVVLGAASAGSTCVVPKATYLAFFALTWTRCASGWIAAAARAARGRRCARARCAATCSRRSALTFAAHFAMNLVRSSIPQGRLLFASAAQIAFLLALGHRSRLIGSQRRRLPLAVTAVTRAARARRVLPARRARDGVLLGSRGGVGHGAGPRPAPHADHIDPSSPQAVARGCGTSAGPARRRNEAAGRRADGKPKRSACDALPGRCSARRLVRESIRAGSVPECARWSERQCSADQCSTFASTVAASRAASVIALVLPTLHPRVLLGVLTKTSTLPGLSAAAVTSSDRSARAPRR